MTQRRELRFANWDEVLEDLDALQSGYSAIGKWDLTQVAKHLHDWLRFPMDGFPAPPLLLKILLPVLQVTVGRSGAKRALAEGTMKAGIPTDPKTVYVPGDAPAAAEACGKLRETIERFRNYTGELHPSPIFGAMSKGDVEKLHLVHFSHHLSFLIPSS